MIKVTTNPSQAIEPKPFPKLTKNQRGEIFYLVRENYGLPLTESSGKMINWTFHEKDFANLSHDQYVWTDYNEPITIQNA
jgi:hypothetical protein